MTQQLVEKVQAELVRYEHPLFDFAARPAEEGVEVEIRYKPGNSEIHDYTFLLRPREIERSVLEKTGQRDVALDERRRERDGLARIGLLSGERSQTVKQRGLQAREGEVERTREVHTPNAQSGARTDTAGGKIESAGIAAGGQSL